MQPVQAIAKIIANLQLLDQYALSSDSATQEFYHNLMRLGNNFVVAEIDGQVFFGPSRFIGYAGNDIHKHTADASGIDGRVTNRAIDSLLGVHGRSQLLEYAYQGRCAELDIKPAQREREFWHYKGH